MNEELPQGWASGEMGDVAKVVGGGTPDSQDPENFSTEGGIPWLTPADLSNNKAIRVARGKRFLTKKGFNNSSAHLVPKGTVLFSSRAPIGYVAIAANEISTNQGFKSFVCGGGICSEYIYFWLRFATPMAEELASGTTFAEISGKNAAKIPLKLAPSGEQRRIVAKLEKLLGKVDACQERLAKIPVLLKRFRQSVLAAASSGRLTADWREKSPNIGTSEELISEVSKRREEKLQKLKATPVKERHAALSEFDNSSPDLRNDLDLPDIPENWSWVDLRFVMSPEEPFCYGVVQPGEDDPHGPRLIRVCDMEGGRVVKESLRGIPGTIHAQYQRSVLRGGEVLVSVVGTIGRAAIASLDLAGINIARAVAKIPVREFEAKFVLLWLSTSRAENWMVGDAREVARKTLNLEQLRTLPIPLPPLDEQQEIVRRVEGLFALADQIEVRFTQARAQVDPLTPSLLARAFRGELVPQDPNDEPAAKLLERILQQKNGGVPTYHGREKLKKVSPLGDRRSASR